MNTHTDTQYATRFFVVDQNNKITYMNIAHCDLYATTQEAYQFGRDMRGLFDGFVIETVTSS